MLNRKDQRVLPAAEGERRIHPGNEIARTAQAQPTGGRAILADMMDDNDRHVVSALQGAQVAENRGHLARLVFVHLMQADKGVENKQTRRLTAHGFGEAMQIRQQIQAHRGCSDDVDGQRVQVQTAMGTKAEEPSLLNELVDPGRDPKTDEDARQSEREAGLCYRPQDFVWLCPKRPAYADFMRPVDDPRSHESVQAYTSKHKRQKTKKHRERRHKSLLIYRVWSRISNALTRLVSGLAIFSHSWFL